MTMIVQIEDHGGYRELTTQIHEYSTTQPAVAGFIPAGPKQMIAHNVYVELLDMVVATLRQHDPNAWWHILSPKRPGPPPNRPSHLTAAAAAPVTPTAAPEQAAEPRADDALGVPQTIDDALGEPRTTDAPGEPQASDPLSEEQMSTQERPVPAGPVWVLAVEGQAPVTTNGPVVLGRRPVAPPEHGDATTVDVTGSDADQVSKTHAALVPQGGILLVSDLGSTNGVAIQHADGSMTQCAPHVVHPVMSGETVLLGTLPVRVHSSHPGHGER